MHTAERDATLQRRVEGTRGSGAQLLTFICRPRMETAKIQPDTTATKETEMTGSAAVRLPSPSRRACVIQAPPDLPTCAATACLVLSHDGASSKSCTLIKLYQAALIAADAASCFPQVQMRQHCSEKPLAGAVCLPGCRRGPRQPCPAASPPCSSRCSRQHQVQLLHSGLLHSYCCLVAMLNRMRSRLWPETAAGRCKRSGQRSGRAHM